MMVAVFLLGFLPISAVWMDVFQLLGQQSVAAGSAGDALKAAVPLRAPGGFAGR